MRVAIHPEYNEMNVACSCGATWKTGSTLGKKRSPHVAIDLSAVVLRDGVPLPQGKTAASKWPALLDRMKVGNSCVLPRASKGGIGGAMSKANAQGRKFALRVLSDTEIGLWRVE